MNPVKIFGNLIKEDKPVRLILDNIYGIGYKKADSICNELLLYPQCKISEVPPQKVNKLNEILESMNVGPKLKMMEIKQKRNLVRIGTIRGQMLQAGLPVNGQRLNANGRTARKVNKRWFMYNVPDENELNVRNPQSYIKNKK